MGIPDSQARRLFIHQHGNSSGCGNVSTGACWQTFEGKGAGTDAIVLRAGDHLQYPPTGAAVGLRQHILGKLTASLSIERRSGKSMRSGQPVDTGRGVWRGYSFHHYGA